MFATIIWNDDPDGNVAHIAEHGLTPEEVDSVILNDSLPVEFSDSSGLPGKKGFTFTGKLIRVYWLEECDDPLIINPVTAFVPDDPLDG
jgi:hypothetical protein